MTQAYFEKLGTHPLASEAKQLISAMAIEQISTEAKSAQNKKMVAFYTQNLIAEGNPDMALVATGLAYAELEGATDLKTQAIKNTEAWLATNPVLCISCQEEAKTERQKERQVRARKVSGDKMSAITDALVAAKR